MITGHQHTIFVDLQERLISEEAKTKAQAVGAKGFKLVGCTCVGQDLQLRGAHYTEIFDGHAGNNYTSEAILQPERSMQFFQNLTVLFRESSQSVKN